MQQLEEKDKIVLRNVYKITRAFVNPAKDPKTGRFPDCVRYVDSNNDIIYKEEDKSGNTIVIPENKVIELYDGKTFDLNDPYDEAEWQAVQNCPLIAISRDQKDASGNYIIDGNSKRYGTAEYYVEVPGKAVNKRVDLSKKRVDAMTHVFDANIGKRRNIAKILGRDMKYSTDGEVTEYLLNYCEKSPETVINVFVGGDLAIRLLLIDAKEKQIITVANGVYYYRSKNVILGANDESALMWLKNPKNANIVEFIKIDTYPQMYSDDKLVQSNDTVQEEIHNIHKEEKSKSKK